MKRIIFGGLAASLVLAGVASAPANATVLASGTQTVYDATVTPLPPNLPSLGYQATQTAEFGDQVTLTGTNRVLTTATVTFSNWAAHSDWPDYPVTGWTHPVTFNIYSVGNSSGTPAVGSLLTSVTKTISIPWRPETTGTCAAGRWSPSGDAPCFGGIAFNATFDLAGTVVPNQIIAAVAYNTETYGASPLTVGGPYNSLNVALRDVGVDGAVPVGTDTNADAVFWNTSTAAWYADGGTAGVGVLRQDTAWAPLTPAISLTASATACQFSQAGTTLTLLTNCSTDQTIAIPSGFTMNGAGYTITAVDPAGGHFVGAVVQATGPAATTVANLKITASNLADVCDAGPNGLRGILFDGVGGTISNNTVTDLEQGTDGGSGCQEGNGIEVRNTAGVPKPSLTISGNKVTDYQKTGILVRDNVAAVITNNTVTGDGPITYIAQNGIQVSYGATAQLLTNKVTGNWYSPKSYVACGLIIYKAGGVSGTKAGLSSLSSQFTNNENDVCNFGKGGSFSPLS